MKTLLNLGLLCVVVGSASAAVAEASGFRSPASESLQPGWGERTVDETYVITPPFTEFVVPITLPFTPDPEAFQSVLYPTLPMCG
jgi:hypothetical protein